MPSGNTNSEETFLGLFFENMLKIKRVVFSFHFKNWNWLSLPLNTFFLYALVNYPTDIIHSKYKLL